MAGIRIEGNISANVAEVTANNQLQVALPQTSSQAGYAIMLSEVSEPDDPAGSIRREPEANADYQLRMANEQTLLNSVFGGSATSANAIQQDVWKQTATTMTATAGGTIGVANSGFLIMNSGNSVTITQGIVYQTYAALPVFAPYQTYYEFAAATINGSGTGKVLELGAGLVTSATSLGLLDGFCFRWNQSGEFRGVLSIAGVEYATAALTAPTDTAVHRYTITANEDQLEFWVDNKLQAILVPPADSPSWSLQPNLPVLMRVFNNSAPTPSIGPQLKVSQVYISAGSSQLAKPYAHTMSGMSGHCSNVPYGQAVGETTNRANGTAVPATVVGTNTGTTLPMTALGGIGRMTAQATNVASAGDMIFCSYQVPAQTTAVTSSKRLYITGVRIAASNGGAVIAVTPTCLVWGLAWGHTAISLATADAVGTKAPRHMVLGQMYGAIGAVIGQGYDKDIVASFQTPVVVNPGEFVAVTVRFLLGTATASQEVVAVIGFEGYWE